MAMFFFYFQMVAGLLGFAIILLGSVIAIRRFRQRSILLQLLGATAVLISAAPDFLRLTHLDPQRHITPAWIWRSQEVLNGGGILLFAIGYCSYWLSSRRT